MNGVAFQTGGCRFVVTPAGALSGAERRALARLDDGAPAHGESSSERPFVIRIVDAPPWMSSEAAAMPYGVPAAISSEGDRVRIAHALFVADLDPLAYEGRLYRHDADDEFGLEITIRTALGCRLPLETGLLLHSAGVVIDGSAVLFFGVSGAGKSTLAEAVTVPVLSDELVAMQRTAAGWRARATGFWGTLDTRYAPKGSFPLRALVELHRGEAVEIEPMNRRERVRRLVTVAVVAPQPVLWKGALDALTVAAAELPVFTMAWKPSGENAQKLVDSFTRILTP